MEENEPMAYRGIKPCGCIGFVAVNEPKLKKEIAEDIQWIVSIGGKIDLVTCEEVRQSKFHCPEHDPKNKPRL